MSDSEQPKPQDEGGQHKPTADFTKHAPPKQPATEQQLRNTEEKIEERMSAFERSTIRLTRAAVAVAILTAAFIAFQAYEMYTGGADTSTIAEASKRSATAAEGFASSAGLINAGIGAAVTKLGMQATKMDASIRATNRIAVQAQRTADIASKQLETSQRAWVSITKESIPLLKFPYSGGISMNVELTYINSGNIPAYQVNIAGNVFLADQTKDIVEQAKQHQVAICERARQDTAYFKYGIAQTIQPKETKTFWWSEGLRSDGVGMVRTDGGMEPVIVGCIYYKDSSSAITHETPFIFDIHQRLLNGQIGDIRFGQELESDDIWVSDFLNGEGRTRQP